MQHLTHARGLMGIYAIVHASSGMAYLGSSSNIGARLNSHRSSLRRGVHKTARLQAAWNEHGETAFTYLLIERVADLADLGTREQAWLEESGSYIPGIGYNRSPSATGAGWQYTAEQKANLSAAHKGLTRSAAHCAALAARTLSAADLAAARERMAAVGRAGKGRKKTKTHRRKIGLPQRGSGNHRALLTEAQVIEIMWRTANGENGRALGVEYGVSEVVISNIKRGKTWRHITDVN